MGIFNSFAAGGGGGVEVKTATLSNRGAYHLWWNLDHVPSVWWISYIETTYQQSYSPKWVAFLDFNGKMVFIDTSGIAGTTITVTANLDSGEFHIQIPLYGDYQFSENGFYGYTLNYID